MSVDALTLLSGVAGHAGVEAGRTAHEMVAFELLTIDSEGWPRVAWLGPAEVMPVDASTVALAVWSGSTTRKNLEQGQAVLQVVVDSAIHRLRLAVSDLGPVPVGNSALAGFLGQVTDVVTDDVAYAEVISGLTYRLIDRQKVMGRWHEQTKSLGEVVTGYLEKSGG